MTFFIRLSNATMIRRGLLESGKELVGVLRGYQKILAIRDEKKEMMTQVQQVLAELEHSVLPRKPQHTIAVPYLNERFQHPCRVHRRTSTFPVTIQGFGVVSWGWLVPRVPAG